MGNCGEVYFGAESGEEYVFVNREAINCQFNVLLELDQLLRVFDNTLRQALAVPSNCIPFHLKDRLTPNQFRGLDIINSHVQPRTPPALTIALKSEVEGKINFSYSSLALTALAIWCLLNNFILSFTV